MQDSGVPLTQPNPIWVIACWSCLTSFSSRPRRIGLLQTSYYSAAAAVLVWLGFRSISIIKCCFHTACDLYLKSPLVIKSLQYSLAWPHSWQLKRKTDSEYSNLPRSEKTKILVFRPCSLYLEILLMRYNFKRQINFEIKKMHLSD